jgi:hypothetical protein
MHEDDWLNHKKDTEFRRDANSAAGISPAKVGVRLLSTSAPQRRNDNDG